MEREIRVINLCLTLSERLVVQVRCSELDWAEIMPQCTSVSSQPTGGAT